jgi:hypothetical protein
MPRYKGRTSFKTIERDFPHIVETVVPPGGLGKTLDAMYAWHQTRGIQAIHGRGRRDKNGRDYIRWCFADPTIAAALVQSSRGTLRILHTNARRSYAESLRLKRCD